MKMKRLLFGLLFCSLFCACSDKEVTDVEPSKVFTDDVAYINVRLADVSATSTKAALDYEAGSEDENGVVNAFFYFYDANGVFVSEGRAWNGGTANTESNSNIEFESNTIVVLKGLQKKNYPKYIVTVLNKAENFTAPATLDEMEKALAGGITTTSDNKEYFTMSTSSYARAEGTTEVKYFVTEIQAENFSLEPIPASGISNVVSIYVERLAAKVTLKLGDLEATTIEGKTYYKIPATVAGADNATEVGSTYEIAAENLYIELLGWKLNGTANNTNLIKNIDINWTEAALGFVWNKPADFRSFWGKSFNYGVADYVYTATQEEGKMCPLDYFSLEEGLVELGSSAYCAENTNDAAILNVAGNFPAAVTSILLKARICDENGEPLDLVRANGVLFLQDAYIKYVLNLMEASNNLNVWLKGEQTAEGAESYVQLDENSVELVHIANGAVEVQLVEGLTLYQKEGEEYTEITDQTVINKLLAEKSAGAIGYNGGEMYYNIPIEHLNGISADAEEIEEANYGVVRNHHYVVTITKLEKIGRGIFDPEEAIVPQEDEEEAYYVGADIDVLAWKRVSQNVEL